jgi:hypothetical protein
VSNISISISLIEDLSQALQGGVLASAPAIRQVASAERRWRPDFGDIFWGVLARFNRHQKHYGMVADDHLECPPVRVPVQGERPAVVFAPITSLRNSNPKTMVLPPGTLPAKKTGKNTHAEVNSYLLLALRMLVGVKTVTSQFERVRRLPDNCIQDARRVLKRDTLK